MCSDSKFVKQQLNFFSNARVDYHTMPKSMVAANEDCDELYGGGRGNRNV